MKKLLILFCLFLSSDKIFPQIDSQKDFGSTSNLAFLEIGGNSPFISINYERFIIDNLGIRAGVGAMLIYGLSFPVMFNYYIGNESNKLEIGLGITHSIVAFNQYKEETSLGTTIGFWHKMPVGGGILRISFTPFYDNKKNKFHFWGGISAGYSF